jgi:acyl transferase domain-containing protein
VQFAAGMQTLRAQGFRVFLEIGPHPVLLGMGRQIWEDDATLWLPSLRKQHDDWRQLFQSVGMLYTNGCTISWSDVEQHRTGARLRLPTYPWQRQRYWLESSAPGSPTYAAVQPTDALEQDGHPLLGQRLQPMAHYPDSYCWEIELDSRRLAYLDHHRIGGTMIMPMAGYIEMAVCAASEAFGNPGCRLADLALHHPLFLDNPRMVQVSLAQNQTGAARFYVYGAHGNTGTARTQWVLHASATVHFDTNGYTA